MGTYYFEVYVDEFNPSRRLYYDGVFDGNPKEGRYEMAYCEEDGPKSARVIGCHPPGDQIAHRDQVLYVDAENVISCAMHRATYRYTSHMRTYSHPWMNSLERVMGAFPAPPFTAANRSAANPQSSFFKESCSDILIREADRLKRRLEMFIEEDHKEIRYLKELERKLEAHKKCCPSVPKKMRGEPALGDAGKPGTSNIRFKAVVELEPVMGIENLHGPLFQQRRRNVVRNPIS